VTEATSIGLVVVVSALLVVTGLKRQPGLGVLGALVLIGLALGVRGEGLASIGFRAPEDWTATLLHGVLLGAALQLFAIVVLDPWSERVTGRPPDHDLVEAVRGDGRLFGLWLVVVWTFVAFVEEAIFRGFLMTETARILGTGPLATTVNVVLASAVFGVAHGYQGPAGILATGLVGLVLGAAFVASGFEIWLVVIAHGVVDTVGLALVAFDVDRDLRRTVNRLWSRRSP
jgi:membrane protease YdiL (CAAX protease family)